MSIDRWWVAPDGTAYGCPPWEDPPGTVRVDYSGSTFDEVESLINSMDNRDRKEVEARCRDAGVRYRESKERRREHKAFGSHRRGRIPPVVPIDPTGIDFITGAKSLKKHQQDTMQRTKRNLWG